LNKTLEHKIHYYFGNNKKLSKQEFVLAIKIILYLGQETPLKCTYLN
jgi:hypothetical protein